MRKFFIIIICIVMISTISCEKRKEYAVKKVNQDMIIYNQLEKTYDYNEILNYLENNKNMKDFYEEYNVEYYKIVMEMYYTVLKTNVGIVIITFNMQEIYNEIHCVVFSNESCEDSIENIRTGITLDEVRAIDPNGNYVSMLHNWTGYPQISYHYFNNGKCFAIKYNNNVVEKIESFTI